jgi:4-hydroxy-tetrahydrodipicolinate reductase
MTERVVVAGIGSTGGLIAKLAIEKRIEIVGASGHKRRLGEDLGEVIGLGKKIGVSISGQLSKISEKSADATVCSTVSRLRDLFRQILPAIKAGIMSYHQGTN